MFFDSRGAMPLTYSQLIPMLYVMRPTSTFMLAMLRASCFWVQEVEIYSSSL